MEFPIEGIIFYISVIRRKYVYIDGYYLLIYNNYL